MTERKTFATEPRADQLSRWVLAVMKRLDVELASRCQSQFPELRLSHLRILQMIPPDGIRITDLAMMTDRSKPGLVEFANWLEEAGFLSSRTDETDRRVRLVSRSGLGDAAVRAIQDAMTAIEEEWSLEIGVSSYEVMKHALRQLGSRQQLW